MGTDADRLARRAERERRARKEAERLLEEKSRELWEANRELEHARLDLEQRVVQRTEEMQQALTAAEDANAAKTRFLAHMSHELRTPLMSILGYTAELRDASPDDLDLATVDRNARHLLALINEVLDLAKVESGTLKVCPVTTPLRDLVSELEATFSPRSSAKGLEFRVSIDDQVPSVVRVDGLRLRQLLLNLLGNAVKFTDRGSVALRVFRPDPDEPSMIRFDVLDTGRGIPPEALSTIFDPFQQVADTDRKVGTGLGLAICNQLASAMGGGVRVTSTVGRGSCFTLLIRAPELEDATPAVPSRLVEGALLDGCRILLAEDARDSRILLTRWCERAGAQVTGVANGALAVERAGSSFDLVLMDMQMPVMDGYTATRTLRDRGFDRPIIALTAQSMVEDRRACEAAGCDDYLSKPVERDRLLATIRMILDSEYR